MPTDGSSGADRQLSKLLEHLVWADERVLASLRAMTHPDQRALDLYAHVLGTEHVWLARMQERTPREKVWPDLSLERAQALAAETAASLRSFLQSLSTDQLQRKIAYRNSAGVAFESTIEDMLLQVMLHGCYHRGQVALLIRGAGAEPAPTDYIAFVRGVPAAVTLPPRR
ncbi:MAG: DinB family protein [Gemmatimonadota bacterium]|nr:DinB family protein [Gemmatimonadota bacterium]